VTEAALARIAKPTYPESFTDVTADRARAKAAASMRRSPPENAGRWRLPFAVKTCSTCRAAHRAGRRSTAT